MLIALRVESGKPHNGCLGTMVVLGRLVRLAAYQNYVNISRSSMGIGTATAMAGNSYVRNCKGMSV